MSDVAQGLLPPTLKRATLWVRNLERSLAIYRDALGLVVLEEKILRGPHIAKMVGLEDACLRIVHLGTPNRDSGWIGLYEISETVPRAMLGLDEPPCFPLYGQTTIVLECQDLPAIHARLVGLPQVRVLAGPTSYEKPEGTYRELVFFDADAIPVSLLSFTPTG